MGGNMGQEPYRIGIVDDDLMTLIGLRAVIVSQRSEFANNVEISWAVRSGCDAIDRCVNESTRPNMVLVDMCMDGDSGAFICRRIRSYSAKMVIIAITSHSLNKYRNAAREAGAQALMDKADARGIRKCIYDYARGKEYIEASYETPLEAYRKIANGRNKNDGILSEKEKEVMNLCIRGMTSKEVAKKLGLSESTIKTHIRHTIVKLGVGNKLQAVQKWTEISQGIF